MFAALQSRSACKLTTCGFETEDTAIVVVEAWTSGDPLPPHCRGKCLVGTKAAAEPLQEDDLRSMVENFNFVPRDCA